MQWLLIALLCPLGAGEDACRPDTAIIAIAHPAPAGANCNAVLMQLQFEAARLPPAGPGEAWRFACVNRQ